MTKTTIHRHLVGLALLAVLVFSLFGLMLVSQPAEAGAICHEGTWQEEKLHCQLGFSVNCTECWVY